MAIKVGCFALINPFSTLDVQLDQIKKWGFTCGDLTDNSDGACLGVEYGFTALGDGVIDIKSVYDALIKSGFDGYSTLEIAGEEAVLKSFNYLKNLGAV